MEVPIALYIAGITLLGFLCQWLGWVLKLPAILILLLCGLMIGPVFDLFNPDLLFGDHLFDIISLCVALILFEGSLTLKYQEIRSVSKVVRHLCTIGVLVSWACIAVISHWLIELSWPMAWLFGALVVVSGPTVIIPMLRAVRPQKRIGNILRWEGILIDPIGAMLAVLTYEYVVSASTHPQISHSLLLFGQIILTGGFLGLLAGWLLAQILRHRLIPMYLQNFAAISMVLMSFTLANLLEDESGLLAVTVMGIYLANRRDIAIEEILSFKEHLSVLLISILFIVLAARTSLESLFALGWPIIALFLCIQFIVRPICVMVSTIGSDLRWQEKALLSWIAPRGIVAAAISALFAIRLSESNTSEAALLVPLTFAIIIGTVLFQSATSRLVANLLKVSEPSPRGVLINGANPVARAIGSALQHKQFDVVLADTNWENISAARMESLPTFYGNPNSEYAENHLDLVGLGRLISLSPVREQNALAALHYRHEFGIENIYAIHTSADAKAPKKQQLGGLEKIQMLADKELTFSKVASLLKQGGKIKTTTLSDSFDFEAFIASRPRYPLFAIDKKQHLLPFGSDKAFTPKSGWQIISLEPAIEASGSSGAEESTG